MSLFSFRKKQKKRSKLNGEDEFTRSEFPKRLSAHPIILEVGAHEGGHTRRFMECFPEGQIYCFEPDPRAIASFQRQIHDQRVRLSEIAIGAATGQQEFFVSDGVPPDADPQKWPEGWFASGSLREPKEVKSLHSWVKFPKTIKVKVETLDNWCESNGLMGKIDLIWADVQGAEIDLIRGGLKTLARTHYLYTEYNEKELYAGQIGLDEMLNLLPHFVVEKRFTDDVLLRNSRW